MKNLVIILALLAVSIGYVHSSVYCYYCADCPIPFTTDPRYVSVVTSSNNFCARKSYSSDPYARNSRGAAEPGLCQYNGCRWINDSAGRQLYVCCCTGNYCN